LTVSDLTPAEQATLDLVERVGPVSLTHDSYLIRSTIASACRDSDDEHAVLPSLLSRGLLLERERTVECPTCWGAGDRSDPYCKGTGSVKERVIGTPEQFESNRQSTPPQPAPREER
jgi:hypothetical protein